MLSHRELDELLHDLESDRADRKASLSDLEKVRQTVCAFANDLPGRGQPGVLFVGVNDDGTCAQLAITDDLLKRLAHLRDDGLIQPLPSLVIEKVVLNGCELAVVYVQPALAPPARCRGRVYVRVGPSTRLATSDEERRLAERRRARDLPFDLHELPSATLEDLDLLYFEREYLSQAVAPEVIERNDRSLHEQLRALRFLGPSNCPTVMGMLVAGKDPLTFVPGAYVQFLRLQGRELTDPIRDEKRIQAGW